MVIGGAEVILHTVALCSGLVCVDGVNVIREGSYKRRSLSAWTTDIFLNSKDSF